MPIELVCFGFSILGGLIGMLLFCLIWEDGFRTYLHADEDPTVTDKLFDIPKDEAKNG